MRGAFVIIFGILLLGGWAHAQSPGGGGTGVEIKTLENDSPTPLHGFTLFSGNCMTSGVPKQLFVCDSLPCNSSSSSLVCASPLTLGSSKTCVSPASISYWGTHPGVNGTCCTKNGSCTLLTTSSPWEVGVFPSSSISNMSLTGVADFRSFQLVRRSSSEWIALAYNGVRPSIIRTTNAGSTWSTPFLLSDLVFPSVLPVNMGTVNITHPALALSPDGSVHLAFTVMDPSNGMSAVYYSKCLSSNSCASSSMWASATPIVDPSLTVHLVDGVEKWKYAFGQPKMVADASSVHIVFDDTQPESVSRINGIFYKTCLFSTGCQTVADFTSPGAPDILNGFQDGGYSHHPSLARDIFGKLHVVYASNSGLYYTRFDSFSMVEWAVPQSIILGPNYSFPFISTGSDTVSVTARRGANPVAFVCRSGNCTNFSVPISLWDDETASLSPLASIFSLSDVIGVASPSAGGKMAFFSTGMVNGLRQLVGLFVDSDFSSSESVHFLSNNPNNTFFLGASDIMGAFAASGTGMSMVDLVSNYSNFDYVVSSDILDYSNSNPILSSLSPDEDASWENPASNPATTTFAKTISFSILDPDAGDSLYASVFLSANPNGEDFPLMKYVNLLNPAGGLGVSCPFNAGTGAYDCVVSVPLFTPLVGLLAPNGNYHLVVKAYDSGGGSDSISSAGIIQLTSSKINFLVNKPSTGEKWSTQDVAQHVLGFQAQQATFAQTLGVSVFILNPITSSTVDFGTIDVATYNATDPSCTHSSGDYNCTIPIGIPSGIGEGVYDLVLNVSEDGLQSVSHVVANMTFDFSSPHLTSHSPSGVQSSFPSQLTFTLSDFSGIDAGKPISVFINGAPSSSPPDCSPPSGIVGSVTCTVPFNANNLSFQSSSTSLLIEVSSTDGLGNSGQDSFSFIVNQPIPNISVFDNSSIIGGIISPIDGLVAQDENGNIIVKGTGIIIPNQIIDSFNNFSNRLVLSASDLVDVTGPSANAIFIGLCTLAGIASDMVFRRIFGRVVADTQGQRQRVIRMSLGLVFFSLPALVGWQFGLAIGFIFALMEVVLFIGAAYLFKILQYYETFGFKPIGPA